MLLLHSDIQVNRTPAELRVFVEQVRSYVRADVHEFELGMAKRGLYKQFLDEVQPLCDFAAVAYPAEFKIRPVLGNQGHDAIVFDAEGNQFDLIELARPHDGSASAKSARQVVKRGYSDVQVTDHTDPLGDLFPFIEATAKAKALKDYSNVTVVFSLASPPPLAGLEGSFDRQVNEIKRIIGQQPFTAKRVFLYVPPGKLVRVAD